MQYLTDKFSLETSPGVTFTQPSATLDFSDEPVAGWFIEPGMLRKVRLTCSIYHTCSKNALIYIHNYADY